MLIQSNQIMRLHASHVIIVYKSVQGILIPLMKNPMIISKENNMQICCAYIMLSRTL